MIVVVVDNREQFAFDFARFPDVKPVPGTLAVGDYSLQGHETLIAVERKSLADLVTCLGAERERFCRELQRGRSLAFFGVVCEQPWRDLAAGRYRSRLNPQAACQSVLALMARTRTPFFFCETREEAEHVTFDILRHFLSSRQEELKRSLKAHGQALPLPDPCPGQFCQ